MAFEVEYGLKTKDIDVVRKRLKSLGAVFIKKERKVMIYYWIPKDLTGCLRVDVRKGSCTLVFKEGDLCGSHKEEHELEIGDARTMHRIFCKLGYGHPITRWRMAEFYKLHDVTVSLRNDSDWVHTEIEKVVPDKTHVEKAVAEINAVMSELGFSKEDRYETAEIQNNIKTDLSVWKKSKKGDVDFDEVYRFLNEPTKVD